MVASHGVTSLHSDEKALIRSHDPLSDMVFDVLIRNGRVIDGTGSPWFKADVAIRRGKIAKVGRCRVDQADRVIDATGFVVSPGFIDIHQHGEIHLVINPNAESLIRQGITTMVGGNCGWSAAPITPRNKHLVHSPWWPREVKPTWATFSDFFTIYEQQGVAINVANLVGHGWIRSAVMGWEARLPTDDELAAMQAYTAEAMADGVFGLSTGLTYPPGCWSNTQEVIELCRIVAKYGGFYATHDRGLPWPAGKAEAIEIGQAAAIPTQISHIETHGREGGRQAEALKLVEAARARGQDVTYDVCTTLYGGGWLVASVMPAWACEGGAPKMLERVSDPATRDKMQRDILRTGEPSWDHIIILWCRAHPEVVGMTVKEIAALWNKAPWDVAFNLLKDDGLDLVEVDTATKGHTRRDLEFTFKQPSCMPNTDSWFYAPYGPLSKRSPHPRGYGGFPIVLRKWVRGETRPDMPEEEGTKLVTLEAAIRKMTSLPAQRLGLTDRGLLQEDMWADVVVFDADRVSDQAPYPRNGQRTPHQYPVGIPYVFVNGTLVIDQGEHTQSLPGQVLRGPGYTPT
jgi:N-acyl-D-amino-acid deacylase